MLDGWSWRDTRALLLAAVLVPNVIYGLPVPPPVTDKLLASPTRQRELAEWTAVLNRLGIDVSEEQVASFTTWSTQLGDDAHRALKAPFRPLARITGTNQSWPLFAAATTTPTRLTVTVTHDDGREAVWFRRLDPEADWHAPFFAYRRVRGVYDISPGRRAGPAFDPFVDTVASWAFAEDPTVRAVRVELVTTPLHYPWEPPPTDGPAGLQRVRRRR